ncbi:MULTISPECIES: ATP-binding cassette domain-containing protein [Gammaproteobacteria]|uniref:ATP-binding cassette domain-containing protein n=1 Tax=Gammaproteobacteria TaxID=1236 RepID=UPI000DD02CC3|nr:MULTISPECIES: ATP-binding cassette domain-containing protein [Gammaproteobacteria]RTE86438.1 ATP-binding cassette domain-containing protein [Aliidiomarina sp. B3213]TCZ91007.1 ATP-binding cassette domain-containing protein [Lysobacter sp. N42]
MIQAEQLQLIRGHKTLLNDTKFTIFPGQRVGLVGANGTGKSSLFALLKGELKEDDGTLNLPATWRIASVAQETPALEVSAKDYVIQGDQEYIQTRHALELAEHNNDGEQIGQLHAKLDAIGGYQIEARAASLLDGLGFTPDQIQHSVKSFSGGWRMRLNLAQALIARSDLLLLDEPTNHLDLDTIVWLESWLKVFPGTVIVISHDRDFLDGIVTHILHIEQQQIFAYQGDYTSFQRQRSERISQQHQQYQKEQEKRAHLQSFVDRFRAKASKAKQAQSRLKALEKLTATAPIDASVSYDLSFPKPLKLPNPLIHLEKVQAGYGDTVILHDIHFNLVPGSRIGLLGRNGAGKSTLTKLLAGELQPLQGEREVNQGLVIGYFAQHQLETLDLEGSAALHIQRIDPKASDQAIRDYLGRFGFKGDRAFEPVGPFSGGEKARLVLAMLVYQRPNLLLLDEPTNHLDLDMREALVAALQEFEGAIVVVSHDRHFLRTTVDDYYLVNQGQVSAFKGDLDDYSTWLQDNPLLFSNSKAEEKSDTNKKAQRQAAAVKRQQLKPLKDKLKKVEKDMESTQAKLDTVNEVLSASDLYQTASPEALSEHFKQQSELENQLALLEEQWLELEEQVQAASSE